MLFTSFPWPYSILSQSQGINKCIHTYVVGLLNAEEWKKYLSDQVFKLELDLCLKYTIAIEKKKYFKKGIPRE